MNRQEDRMPHSTQFLPESVDEQIDQLSRLPESETVNGQFISDLHITSKEYIERRDRVWARIEEQVRNRYGTEQMGILPNGLPGSNFAGGQQKAQQRHFPFSLLHSRRTPLELIAAVLVAVLVVGSMLWLVGVTHPFKGGTTIVASGPTSSQTSSKPVISGQGTVYPNQEQDIQYAKPMYVAAVNVSAGQAVKVGQTLMQLYPADNAQVQNMYNKVLAAKAQLKADQVNHPERVAADKQQLAQAQTYITQTLSPSINDQIKLLQAKILTYQALLQQDQTSHSDHVSADQQQLQLAESEYAQLQAMPQEVTVITPISGVVTQVNTDPVKIVAANTPMLTIMDESTVVVHAKVPQTFMSQVHTYQLATITTSAVSGLSVKGTVTEIIPTVDPKTHTFEVWVSVPNSTKQLLVGMRAQVQIQAK
jgi:multidrug efflux pump subunit AcrA (membrane-fusion protein)